jgi:site-specific recombinase XerD
MAMKASSLERRWRLCRHPLVERYLEHVRVEKRLAARTVELYSLDLQKTRANAAKAGVPLPRCKTRTCGAGSRRCTARAAAAAASR